MKNTPQWEEQFDQEFGLFSNYADFCPDGEEYKRFIRTQIEAAEGRIIAELEGMKREPNRSTYLAGNTLTNEYREDSYNRALTDAIALIRAPKGEDTSV